MQRGARLAFCDSALMQRGARFVLGESAPMQRGARLAFCESAPMQRGARRVFCESAPVQRGTRFLLCDGHGLCIIRRPSDTKKPLKIKVWDIFGDCLGRPIWTFRVILGDLGLG